MVFRYTSSQSLAVQKPEGLVLQPPKSRVHLGEKTHKCVWGAGTTEKRGDRQGSSASKYNCTPKAEILEPECGRGTEENGLVVDLAVLG